MLISRRYGFIFIHVPRTAGISISQALATYADKPEKTPLRKIISKLPIRQPAHSLVAPIHSTASWARHRLGRKRYEALLSFAVVRNPYDRTVSQYEFIRQQPRHHRHTLVKDLTFQQYIDYLSNKPAARISRQADMIADANGHIIVNRLLRFETLARDFNNLCVEIGFTQTPALPHQNHAPRAPEVDYLQSDYTKQLIYKLYRDDFTLLGYPE